MYCCLSLKAHTRREGTVYRHCVGVVCVEALVGSGYRVVMETLCMRVPGCVFVRG